MIDAPRHDLYSALLEEGFKLPNECADVRLTLPVDDVAQLHLVINLSGDELARIGRALQKIGQPLHATGITVNVNTDGGTIDDAGFKQLARRLQREITR